MREAVSAPPTPKPQQVDLTVKEGGATASDGGASDKTKTPEMKATSAAAPSSTGHPVGQSPNTSQSEEGEAGGPVDEAPASDEAHSQGVAVAENVDAVDVSRNEDGSYKSYVSDSMFSFTYSCTISYRPFSCDVCFWWLHPFFL